MRWKQLTGERSVKDFTFFQLIDFLLRIFICVSSERMNPFIKSWHVMKFLYNVHVEGAITRWKTLKLACYRIV